MEVLQEYRHIVEKETKQVFFDSVKKAIKELKLKHIGFIGVVGSVQSEKSHDIDLLIFPRKDSKIGEVIIEVAQFYDKVEQILKKHHERFYISLAPKKVMQEMIYYLSTIEEGAAGLIPIHSLFFTNYRDFISFNPKGFRDSIKKDLKTFYGSFDVIKKNKEIPQEKLEPYFVIIDFEMNVRTKTFPRHLVRSSAESLFSYLRKKYKVPIKRKKFHSIPEIEAEIKRILKYLDSVSYGN